MKTLINRASIGLICLLGSSLVLAKPLNDLNLLPEDQAKLETKQCDRGQGFEHRLETLKSALKLSADQEPAWNVWFEKIKADKSDRQDKHETIEAWKDLPPLERMENMLKLAKERVAKQEAHLTATKAFYATLTAGQRQTFDKEFKFPHHQQFSNHGKYKRPGHSM